MKKVGLFVVAVAIGAFVGAWAVSWYLMRTLAVGAPGQEVMWISSTDKMEASDGPSAFEIMQQKAKQSMDDFAAGEMAGQLAALRQNDRTAADAALRRNAAICFTERAGVELPEFQQRQITDGVMTLMETILARGNPPAASPALNGKAGAYVAEQAGELSGEIESATVGQMLAAQTVMNEFTRNPGIVLSCMAERTVEELHQI